MARARLSWPLNVRVQLKSSDQLEVLHKQLDVIARQAQMLRNSYRSISDSGDSGRTSPPTKSTAAGTAARPSERRQPQDFASTP